MARAGKKQKKSSARAQANMDISHSIVTKFTHALTWRTPYKEKWDRFYNLYRSVLNSRAYPWQSNVFVPYAFSTVETVAPRMVASKPQIDILPREPQDTEYAKVMNKLIDFQWDEMEMDKVLPDAVKEMLIYGSVIMKVYWSESQRVIEEMVPVDESFPELGQVEDQREVLDEHPVAELVDLYDFFWDPRGTDIDNCRWVIHRMYRTLDHLKDLQKQGIYKNVDLVETQRMPRMDDEKDQRRSAVGISIPTDIEQMEGGKQIVELLEYWEDDKVVTIANRAVVIRDESNPHKHGKKPFVKVVDQSVPHEFLGIGELEPIETAQYELNSIRNQRRDNATLALNRMWIIDNSANVDEDELVSDAGGVVHTNDMAGIRELIMPDVTASSYKEETEVKADIQQTSGVSDFTRGLGSDSLANDTATGISLIQEAANARFKLKLRNLEGGIQRIGKLMVSLNEQFITEQKVVRIVGNDGEIWDEIKPEDLRGNFDVQVEAGSTLPANDAVNRKQTLDAYQLFAGDPEVNQLELKRMVAEVVLPKANLDKLLPRAGDGSGLGTQPPQLPSPNTEEGLTQEAQLTSALAPDQVQ